jgi:hypothetical protein
MSFDSKHRVGVGGSSGVGVETARTGTPAGGRLRPAACCLAWRPPAAGDSCPSKFIVNQRQKLLGRLDFTTLRSFENTGDLAHSGKCTGFMVLEGD